LHPGIFVRKPGVPKWDRKRVLEHIGDIFQTTELIPKHHDIKLSDNKVVTIPVTNWEALAREILDDPEVIELISEHLDPDTWCPKGKPIIHENNANAIIGEKDSGYLSAMDIDLHYPRCSVKFSFKSTFGFSDFPPDFCHRKSPGHFYWHADLIDQSAHFTLY
jgi:hypothetical protein